MPYVFAAKRIIKGADTLTRFALGLSLFLLCIAFSKHNINFYVNCLVRAMQEELFLTLVTMIYVFL